MSPCRPVIMAACAALVCLVVWSAPAVVRAGSLALTGDWEYQDSRADGSDFSQNYVIDLGHRLPLTPAMSLEGELRYNRREETDDTLDNLSPTVTYELRNPLFFLHASGHANEQHHSNKVDTSNRSVDVNWNSNWQPQGFLPAVSANYNRNWFDDDNSPKTQDTDSTNTGGSLTWDHLPVKAFYSYNWQEDNNHVVSSRYRSDTHLGRLSGERDFWEERGSLSVSGRYSYTKNENRVLADAAGVALVKIATTAYSATADPDATVTLSPNSALTNGVFTDTAVSVNDPADPLRLMIGFKANYQQVDVVYLFTVDALGAAESAQFTWALYYSDNNADWTLANPAVTTSYSAADKRFTFDVSGYRHDFLRLVAVDDPASTQVDFSELEIYRKVTSTANEAVTLRDNVTLWSTDVNLSLELTPDLTLTSNFSYEVNDYSLSSDLNTTKANAGLRWDLTADVFADLNASYTLRDRDEAPEEEYRTYGLSLTAPLLPTVTSVWGATLSEDFTGGKRQTTTYNYDLELVADLYTDLDSRLNLSYDQTDDELTNDRTATSKASLNLTARLIPGLVANYSADYSKVSGESEVIDMDLDFHWRRSEYLVLRGAARQTWESGENTTTLSFGVDLAMTSKMQLTLNQGYAFEPERKYVTALDWRWTLTDNLSLLTTGSYESGDEIDDAWSVVSRLNARFER